MENEKKAYDIYVRGEWYVTIMKVELTEDQAAVFTELQERSADATSHVELLPHNADYPEPNWRGHTRR